MLLRNKTKWPLRWLPRKLSMITKINVGLMRPLCARTTTRRACHWALEKFTLSREPMTLGVSSFICHIPNVLFLILSDHSDTGSRRPTSVIVFLNRLYYGLFIIYALPSVLISIAQKQTFHMLCNMTYNYMYVYMKTLKCLIGLSLGESLEFIMKM